MERPGRVVQERAVGGKGDREAAPMANVKEKAYPETARILPRISSNISPSMNLRRRLVPGQKGQDILHALVISM
jgi:hypothetical protein